MALNGVITGTPSFASGGQFSNCVSGFSATSYIVLPSGSAPNTSSWGYSVWLKNSSATGTQVAGYVGTGSGNIVWFGTVNGVFVCDANIAGSTNADQQLSSGVNISDGGWHQCVVNFTSIAMSISIGNNTPVTLALSGSPALGASLGGGIGGFQPIYGAVSWLGSIDELSIWSGPVSNAVQTAPYTGKEANLLALYHLESDATDSNANLVRIDPSNSAITYSPYNWVVAAGSAKTINSGAYLKVQCETTTSIALSFDTTNNVAPYSEIVARVDGGAWITLTLAAGNPTLTVATGLDDHTHLLEVMVKSTSETLLRWSATAQTMITLTSIILDEGAGVYPVVSKTKHGIVFGDSITEGVRTINSTAVNDTDRNDVRCDYSYGTLSSQDFEFGVIGFGATGITVSGSGSVPPLPQTYNVIFPGFARSFATAPDLIIINHGTNDQNVDPATFQAAYLALVQEIRALLPSSQILLLRPFGGYQAAAIQAVAAATETTYVDTTGWFNTIDSSDGTHPYGYAHLGYITPKLIPTVAAALYSNAERYSFS